MNDAERSSVCSKRSKEEAEIQSQMEHVLIETTQIREEQKHSCTQSMLTRYDYLGYISCICKHKKKNSNNLLQLL